MDISTCRLPKSGTFVHIQLLYQFEVHVPKRFHLHFLVLFFRVSLLVRCVCARSLRRASAGRGAANWLQWTAVVPATGTTPRAAWLHWTTVVLTRPTHLYYTAAPAQNRTKLSLIHDDRQRSSHDAWIWTLLRLLTISACQNAQMSHNYIHRFLIMWKL